MDFIDSREEGERMWHEKAEMWETPELRDIRSTNSETVLDD